MDAQTICRYEQISDDMADSITILQIGGTAIQGIIDAPSDPAEAWNYWKKRVDRMRNGTMVKRPWYVYLYTQTFFDLSNQEMMQYFGVDQISEGKKQKEDLL